MQSLWIQDITGIVILAVAVEAAVQLIREAGPLQPLRYWLIIHSPWLYSKTKEQHLLDCGYCMSVWVAVVFVLFLFLCKEVTIVCLGILAIHRISNMVHLGISIVRDHQLDLRCKINRKLG